MRLISRSALHAFALIGAAIILCRGVADGETNIPWKIDEPTAERLAAEGVFGGDRYLDSFDYDSHLDPPFFEYYGINDPPAEGGFGFLAVNPWTGDVWALWGCRRLATPALRKSQAAIRRRFTRDELKQYARLRRLKPECIVEN
jgi:hypothetical protein